MDRITLVMPESPVPGKLARRVWRGAFGAVPLLRQLAGCLPYLNQPNLHSWSEKDEPLHLQELSKNKNDPDPKALACYGMLEADSGRMHLRFVSGRPVSQVTIDFLEWLCERVQAQGKSVLVLIWENASWHVSKQVNTWLSEHNQRVRNVAHTGKQACASSRAGCLPKAHGSTRSSQSGSMGSALLSNQIGS